MSRSVLRLTSSTTTTTTIPPHPPTTLLSLPSALRPTIYTNTARTQTRHNATTTQTHHNATTTTTTSPPTTTPPKPTRPRTALFFPGQGVQRVGMTSDWLAAFPRTVAPILDEIDATLNLPLSKIIADGPNSPPHRHRQRPARHHGHQHPDPAREFAALVAGGYLREPDALKMVRRRGEVFERCSRDVGEEVGMVALVSEPEHMPSMVAAIHDFLGHASEGAKTDAGAAYDSPPVDQVLIANVNAKNQIVLSGSIRRINELLTHLRQFAGHDPRAVRLKSDSPFHSPLMAPAAALMKRMLSQPSPTAKGESAIIWPGRIPAISNVTARPFASAEQLKDLLARQAVETVRWHDSIVYLHKEDKVRRWIGIGPGKVGRNLVGKEVGMKGGVKGGGVWGVSDPREIEGFMKELDMTENAAEEEEDFD
ncbi:hypothetical protein Q7P37_002444 [Cladosporium fusiforme]